jgi:DNA-binding MarR family transcriptional regulator
MTSKNALSRAAGGARAQTETSDGGSSIPQGHAVPSFLARRFQQLCAGILFEVLGSEGLTTREYGALTTLDSEPGIDQQRLAVCLGIDKVSAGQLIDRLERDGLVTRRVHPIDRRARVLNLSPQGAALRRRLKPAAVAAQDRILSALVPEERRTLIDLLTRVINSHSIYVRPGSERKRPKKRSAPEESPAGDRSVAGVRRKRPREGGGRHAPP